LVGGVVERVVGAIERLVEAEARFGGLEGEEGEEGVMMSGAIPVEEGGDGEGEESGDTMDMLDAFPRAGARYSLQSSSGSPNGPSSSVRETRSPRQRVEVIARLQEEENNTALQILRADETRQGSADGSMITYMIMSGAIDHRFVLPYLAYIKRREVRGLKDWLAERELVTKSGGTSRIEKVLHCVQMLQTGMRYESIAVIFSRSPEEVAEACHEVVDGLLQLYEETERDGEGEEEVHARRWGVAKRYEVNKRAQEYFGFSWEAVQKVLVALNAFIGRYGESQSTREGKVWWGRFAGVDSQAFVWEDLESYRGSSSSDEDRQDGYKIVTPGGLHGRYDREDPEGQREDEAEDQADSEGQEDVAQDGGDMAEDRETSGSSSSPYEEPNIQAIPRPSAEGN
jgi:hypothetical protein